MNFTSSTGTERKYRRRFIILSATVIAIFFVSFAMGRFAVPAGTVVKILLSAINDLLRKVFRGLPAIAAAWSSREQSAVIAIRLPRIVTAAAVGAALAAAGAAYQGMFRNPMVSPDILGASTGAGFGAALGILLGFGYLGITGTAFVFGLAAVMLAWILGRTSRMEAALAMVLAGIMVGSLFSAGTSYIKLVADTNEQLPAITYWLMGSLASVKRQDMLFALIPITVGLVPLILLRWRINLLTVSEEEARSMGISTDRLRAVVILCATLMTSASVSVSGMIGWVGLAVPHFARMCFGSDYRRLIPASALMGAAFLMAVDDAARLIAASEIPLGILTAFIGAPVFLFLIVKGGGRHVD